MKFFNESRIIEVKQAERGIMNHESPMIPLPPPRLYLKDLELVEDDSESESRLASSRPLLFFCRLFAFPEGDLRKTN